MKGKCYSKRIKIHKYRRKYKKGDTIVIETDSEEFLKKARKEYARSRKKTKNK